MAMPSNVNYGNVVGQFISVVMDGPTDPDSDPDSVPMSGTITFIPSAAYALNANASPNPVTIIRSTVVCSLDSEGYLTSPGNPNVRSVTLLATDDPDLQPVGWTWTVSYNLYDPSGRSVSAPSHPIQVPTNETVDLTLARPVASSNGSFIIRGETGAEGPVGPSGIPAYIGDWVAGTYPQNTLTTIDGSLFAALQTTSESPTTGENHIPVSDVTGGAWTRNGVASIDVGTGEVVLINNTTFETATVLSTATFSGFLGKVFHFDVLASGSADDLHFGIVPDTVPATSLSAGVGVKTIAGFYGVALDIYNNSITPYLDGTIGTPDSPMTDNAEYAKYSLGFGDNGDGTTTMTLVLDATSATIGEWTFATPSYTAFRFAVGSRTGGSTGYFKLKGTPTATSDSAQWRRLVNIL